MNITAKQGQSITLAITLDAATTMPLYVGIYSSSNRSQRLLLTLQSGLTQLSERVYTGKITPQQTKLMQGIYSIEILIGEPTGESVAISTQPMTMQIMPSNIGREVVR